MLDEPDVDNDDGGGSGLVLPGEPDVGLGLGPLLGGPDRITGGLEVGWCDFGADEDVDGCGLAPMTGDDGGLVGKIEVIACLLFECAFPLACTAALCASVLPTPVDDRELCGGTIE